MGMTTEVWKDIYGYEGIAQVSNFGRIKSINREFHNYTKKERILKPTLTNSGKSVHLFKDGKQKTFKLERLVANAFLPNPDNHKYIKFLDGNPMNVNVSNLEWFEGKHLNVKDFIGKKFGFLTVIGDEKFNNKQRVYKCVCDCGNIYYSTLSGLKSGHNISCGKCNLTCSSRVYKRIEDLSGLRFEKLVVISVSGRDNFGRAKWLCKCDCGNTIICNAANLKSGTTKSCGCLKHKPSSKRKDLTNKKFGKLTVLGYSHTNKKYAVWNCRCDCGREIQVNAPYLYNGKVKSCGCLANNAFAKEYKGSKWANDNKIIFGECVKCGCKNNLHSHHILPRNMYPEHAENYANGVTLCRECHKEFHKLYGYKCDIKDLVEYLGLHPYVENVIELLINFRSKNGKQDLEKAKHYINLLIELEYGNKE